MVNILLGTFVAVLTKTMDYWFKDKDDPETKESDRHAEQEKLNTELAAANNTNYEA